MLENKTYTKKPRLPGDYKLSNFAIVEPKIDMMPCMSIRTAVLRIAWKDDHLQGVCKNRKLDIRRELSQVLRVLLTARSWASFHAGEVLETNSLS